jgi:prephenate dehydrogenase
LSLKNITIVGLGLIGGSLAAAFKRKKIASQLIGIDHKPVVEKALKCKLIQAGFGREELRQGIREADLIILATPIKAILALTPIIAEVAKPGALVTDVGSTKEEIVNTTMAHLPKDVYFLGGHPMTGSEKKGLKSADPFLFENAIYVLTKTPNVPNELVEAFVEMIEAIGSKVLFLSPKLHDEIAAVVSHLPQMLAVTLMHYASKLNKRNAAFLKLAAGGFRDMTRVASSPYELWADICKTNSENIKSAIDQFISELTVIKNLISDSKLESIFNEAAQSRLSIPRDTRGFLRPHFDLSVVVEDKPGMIAAISTPLAEQNINIKDIEVLKVREGDAGTLRLAFESEEEREQTLQLLVKKGFLVTKRD